MKASLNKGLLRKMIVLAVVALALMSGSAFAATSYMTISAVSDGEDGPTVYMTSGSVTMQGQNYTSSSNTLWVELFENVTGTDRYVGGKELAIGSKPAPWGYQNGHAGNYYVHLDPDGPYYTGCNGWGQAAR